MSGVGAKILRAFVKADSGDFATDRTLELNPKLHRLLIIKCDGPWYSTVKETRRASPGSVNRHGNRGRSPAQARRVFNYVGKVGRSGVTGCWIEGHCRGTRAPGDCPMGTGSDAKERKSEAARIGVVGQQA